MRSMKRIRLLDLDRVPDPLCGEERGRRAKRREAGQEPGICARTPVRNTGQRAHKSSVHMRVMAVLTSGSA